ncbi:CI-B8 domain-containing protein [Aspergillus karnatakaensis]|uniref:mitochondrial 54S ribosomal protein mL61 n=1 Tax=Aspergillus karnatakaensis TaxID=1810916 RepID=UPI003CCCF39C
MPNLVKRLRKLQQRIVNVRVGTGAAILPSKTTATPEFPAITRLHLTYAQQIYKGHQGARHFWRNCLPRLKYHNPGIPMTVKQTQDNEAPPLLTVYFAENLSKSSQSAGETTQDLQAPEPSAEEKTAVVDLRHLAYTDIWRKLKSVTGAKEIEATEEEQAQIAQFSEWRVKSREDRARIAALTQAKKDHEAMLAAARGEVEKLRASA